MYGKKASSGVEISGVVDMKVTDKDLIEIVVAHASGVKYADFQLH